MNLSIAINLNNQHFLFFFFLRYSENFKNDLEKFQFLVIQKKRFENFHIKFGTNTKKKKKRIGINTKLILQN